MHLRLERWASPISPLLPVTDTKGILRALEYADYEPRMHWLLRRHYGSYTLEEGAAPLSLTQVPRCLVCRLHRRPRGRRDCDWRHAIPT